MTEEKLLTFIGKRQTGQGMTLYKAQDNQEYVPSKYAELPEFAIGRTYKLLVESKQNGKFMNHYIKALVSEESTRPSVAKPQPQPQPQQTILPVSMNSFDSGNELMAKQSAYKNAVAIGAAFMGIYGAQGSNSAEDILSLAEKLVNRLAVEYYQNMTGKTWDNFVVGADL